MISSARAHTHTHGFRRMQSLLMGSFRSDLRPCCAARVERAPGGERLFVAYPVIFPDVHPCFIPLVATKVLGCWELGLGLGFTDLLTLFPTFSKFLCVGGPGKGRRRATGAGGVARH